MDNIYFSRFNRPLDSGQQAHDSKSLFLKHIYNKKRQHKTAPDSPVIPDHCLQYCSVFNNSRLPIQIKIVREINYNFKISLCCEFVNSHNLASVLKGK